MMAIPKEIRDYVRTQIQYYISESRTYKNMAEAHNGGSAEDTAFGMILGCLYLGFMQAYRTQYITPGSEDMDEFHRLVGDNALRIREALRTSTAQTAVESRR
jgi:hypothetical protein